MKKAIIILSLLLCITLSKSQTTYTWNGAVSSSFSAAGNWTPVRQVGLATDILVFNTGTTLNITNVNQVTVGQLLVLNHTHVKLSPSTGNAKTISIQGTGDSHGTGNISSTQNELADVKYGEYTLTSDNPDLATLKYSEYMKDSTAENDLAALKYLEYRNPSANGMGDIKKSEGEWDSMAGEDLMIDSGSSLTIAGSDPNLSVYLKQNAVAAIEGKLIFTGEGLHTINSYDTHAITFKDGSEFIQSCPGNAFTSAGINNSVFFEDGSTFTVNHTGAKDPFGAVYPSSKVIFSSNSLMVYNTSCEPMNVSGRELPNILVKPNASVNINVPDNVSSDMSINNVVVNSGGKLTINHTSNNNSGINIKGNLLIDGELKFPQNNADSYRVSFNGTSTQNISGSGLIDFSPSVNKLIISNDLFFNRDLTIRSKVIHTRGNINTNGHILQIYGQYVSELMKFVGIVITPAEYDTHGETVVENTDVIQRNNPTPASFSISQNYPNPFNPKTKINYTLPGPASVSITVYDLSGKEVAILVNEKQAANDNTAEFDGTGLASGIYFYRIHAVGDNGQVFTQTLKMILTK